MANSENPAIPVLPEIKTPSEFLARIEERNDVDYKREFATGKKGLANLIKDCAALANYGGGVLIYGVDNRTLVGVPDNQCADYDPAKVHDKIKHHLSPVPTVQCEIIEHDGKKFPFLKIGQPVSSPILVSNQLHDEQGTQVLRPGTVFFRENTQTIEVSSERHMRSIIDGIVALQVRRRLVEIVPIFKDRQIQSTPPVVYEGKALAKDHCAIEETTPKREITIIPEDQYLNFDRNVLLEALRVRILNGNFYFPFPQGTGAQTKISPMNTGHVAEYDAGFKYFCRQLGDGSLYWAGLLPEDVVVFNGEAEEKRNFIFVYRTINTIVLSLKFLQEYLKVLDSHGVWKFTPRLAYIAGRTLRSEQDPFFNHDNQYKAVDGSISQEWKITLKDLDTSLVGIACTVINDIFHKFSFFGMSEDQLKHYVEQFVRGTHVTKQLV